MELFGLHSEQAWVDSKGMLVKTEKVAQMPMVTTIASLSQTALIVLWEIPYKHLTEEEKACLLVVPENM